MSEFDQAYFETIYFENYDRLYTAFLKRTGSDIIAQELTQLTFIKLWQYRHSYSFELSAILQLNRKAKQVFIDWLRKEAHQRKLIAQLKEYVIPEYPTSKIELSDTLKLAIQKLPPVRKKVFTLAYIEGFSQKEIAESLGISVKTVDAHIQKALKQLRKNLCWIAILTVLSHSA